MNYIKLNQVTNLVFYQVPKVLFTGKYIGMSNNARMTYALLRDRLDLSIKNNWSDKNGNVFIIYPRQNLADNLNVSLRSIIKYMKELSKLELINEVRQGINKPNIIYICMPVDTENTRKCKKCTSRNAKSAHQEMQYFQCNDTKPIKTYLNDTKSLIGNESSITFDMFINSKGNLSLTEDIKEIVSYYVSKYKNIYNKEIKYDKNTWIKICESILENDTGIDLSYKDNYVHLMKEAIDKHFDTFYKHKEMYLLHNFKGKCKDNRLFEAGIL